MQVDWNTKEISFIHTAFYVGTIISVFFAHYISQCFGAKLSITIGFLISTLCIWAIPLLVYIYPFVWSIILLRTIIGFSQGLYFKSIN